MTKVKAPPATLAVAPVVGGAVLSVRLLPCDKCKAGAQAPRGEPMLSARYVAQYRCSRCRSTRKLLPQEWARISVMTLEDFEAHPALRRLPLRDLRGAGLSEDHARDLFQVGVYTAHDVAEMERKPEPPAKPKGKQ